MTLQGGDNSGAGQEGSGIPVRKRLNVSSLKDERGKASLLPGYWIELATDENALLAFEPTNLIVPATSTRMTASMTAYSAKSNACADSLSDQIALELGDC
jgi:hypothetical protein